MTTDFEGALASAAELSARYLGTVEERPVWQPVPDVARAWFADQDLPQLGRPLEDLLADIETHVLPYPMGNGHPAFFGWVNSPPSPAGVAVSSLMSAFDPSCAGGDHAGPLLERTVVRWLAEIVGFPVVSGGGLLTSGASIATIVAVAAARQRATRRLGYDVREQGLFDCPPLVVYMSQEGHSCLRKAVELLGIGNRQIHLIPVDDAFRMQPKALRARIEQDLADGLTPIAITGTAGTVNSGAIDDLSALADIAAEFDLWLHVDGAYGALGAAATHPDPLLAGIGRADSVALDPHKWLGVPVDCGCVLLKDPAIARDAFSLVPAYLRDDASGDLGWIAEYGPEQTRPFRALKVWATLANLGRAGVTSLVDHTVALAEGFAGSIAARDDMALIGQSLSIVAFRYEPDGYDDDAIDRLNSALPVAIQRRGRTFITGTTLGGRPALRVCILGPKSGEEHLELLMRDIEEEGSKLLAN